MEAPRFYQSLVDAAVVTSINLENPLDPAATESDAFATVYRDFSVLHTSTVLSLPGHSAVFSPQRLYLLQGESKVRRFAADGAVSVAVS